MKFIQKSSDKKVLITVIMLAALLIAADLVYSGLSFTKNDVPQFSAMEASVTYVTALDPSNSTWTVALADLLKVCPTEKISNKMPTTIPNDNLPSVYFILDGERHELDEFDLPWVAGNCTVEEQVVY